MKTLNLILPIMSLLTMLFGCGEMAKPAADWTKAKKIAGREQKLSHISGMVVDDKFAYATIGGTVADQNEGTNGLRKIALDSGAVTILDDGVKNSPQSEKGGIAADEKYVYWNAGGNIMRIAKDGGKPEAIVSENVGIGVDLAIDNEKVYWTNHYYYSANNPAKPSPIYMVSKQGGKAEIFADRQQNPGNIVADEKFIYWRTATGIFKQTKSGGQPQVVYQLTDKEGVDVMSQDAENLYFGFRGAGESRWAIRKVSKNGGEPQTLVKDFALKPFIVDEANVYFFDNDKSPQNALCKISKNGGDVARLDTGYANGVIANGKTLVYFVSSDDIYSFTK